MAVYTEVTDAELDAFLAGFDVGRPILFKGIAEGVENTNFLLETTGGRFILTVFEQRVRAADLPFFLGLTSALADRGFPAPTPVPDRHGRLAQTVRGKPAALVRFLPGRAPRAPDASACMEAGRGLAWLHRAGDGLDAVLPRRANDLGQGAWKAMFAPLAEVAEALRPGLAALMAQDLDRLERAWPRDLPSGFIHGDFFPDNVFLRQGRFAGAIDFYFAAWDSFAYDLAIAANAWSIDATRRPGAEGVAALMEGYASRRPLAPAEREALPILAYGAAMRFCLTRLKDWGATASSALVRRKDPIETARLLELHRTGAFPWPKR